MSKKLWTPEELQLITEEYSYLGAIEIAGKLNRSISSIKSKASRLGLKFIECSAEQYLDKLAAKSIFDHWPIEDYINDSTNILHECLYGHTWRVRPSSILSGTGCPHCKGTIRKSTSQYKAEISNTGIKVLEPYINANTKIKHSCEHGHEWDTRPSSILLGHGCPSCNKTGFNPSLPALLYYCKISISNNIYYKVGITNRTFADRFSKDKDKDITLIASKMYSRGYTAQKVENLIFNRFKDFRINIPNLLKSGGNTELFSVDITKIREGQ